MGSRHRYLEEQLQRADAEAAELRGNLRELKTKFFQLERAFEINLQSQTHREVQFNRMKLESEETRRLNDQAERVRTELNSGLMNAITERDHWKNAFLRQREIMRRNKSERDAAAALVKRDYEDILADTRETVEKQLREIAELRKEKKEKMTQLEEHVEAYEGLGREREKRTLELANLLETLKRFDVDVGCVCQLAAEALKKLPEPGNLFEESMRNLRHLAWTVKDRKDEPQQLVLLKEQNSVLREVVKNLKRKVLGQTDKEIPERKNEGGREEISPEIETNARNIDSRASKESTLNKETVPAVESSINSVINGNNNDYDSKKREESDDNATRALNGAQTNDNRCKQFDMETTLVDKCGKVLCIESHLNDVVYEEYVFKLTFNREIKMKYPILLNDNESVINLEFVDNEADYEKTPPDRMLILFKNIYAAVTVKQTGVSCSTQTMKRKTSNNLAQTTLSGINSFSRLNVGATMLNSEKRAIERSLCNLERTVEALKCNVVNKAETMIAKNSHLLGNNEMLDCIRTLSR